MTAVEISNDEQDQKMTAVEISNDEQDKNITGVEISNDEQDQKIDSCGNYQRWARPKKWQLWKFATMSKTENMTDNWNFRHDELENSRIFITRGACEPW